MPTITAPNPRPRLLTTSEAAAQLRVCPRTIRNYAATGRLESVRVGGRVRIYAHSVDRITHPDPW